MDELVIKNLFIVYGSETALLKKLFNFENSYFLRIYNKKAPEKLKNAIDLNNFEDFKISFNNLINEKTPKKIIFIGAAFLTQNKLFISETESHINKMIEVNIQNYVKYCYYILPQMKKIGSGQFIYLSSFRSKNTTRGTSLYSASKAFGEKFFEVLGKENGVFGIYSVSIRLGYFDSRMTNMFDPDKIKQFKISIGNRRLGTQEDLINCIKFLLINPYTNGGAIDLTGGINY